MFVLTKSYLHPRYWTQQPDRQLDYGQNCASIGYAGTFFDEDCRHDYAQPGCEEPATNGE